MRRGIFGNEASHQIARTAGGETTDDAHGAILRQRRARKREGSQPSKQQTTHDLPPQF
jgi:hypothetical protein